ALYFALASRRHPSCAVSPLPLHCFPTRRSSDLIVGAGATGESGMDAGNMIKPMLARGELRMVGATTLDEYREHIETDAALERRFQQVVVGEPTTTDTVGILRGLKERHEGHNGVRITDAALVSAATLSDRY